MPHFGETFIDQRDVPRPFWTDSDLPIEDFPPEQTNIESPLCAICGLHARWYRDGDWRCDAVVLGDLAREYEYVQTNRKYRPNSEDPAVFSARIEDICNVSKGRCFTLKGTSQFHFVYAADTDRFNGGPSGKNTVYILMHRSCFLIALKAPVWDQTTSSPLRSMFRVFRHRYQVTWEQMLQLYPPPHESTFLNWGPYNKSTITFPGFQSTDEIERGYFSYTCFREYFVQSDHYLSSDPLNIPKLTETLLMNLEVRPSYKRTKEVLRFRKYFRRLPNELKLQVFENVTEAQDWPLTCTRLLGPLFWKTLFNKNNPCFTWLWDLDEAMIRRTDTKLTMDWELLFRKISQGPKLADCFGGDSESDFETFRGGLKYVPRGLEGRRRIWKLLSEMYIGDRSTRWKLWLLDGPYRASYLNCTAAEVPVYWGKAGERLADEDLRAL